MATKSRVKRNHHARSKRAFPDQYPDVRLANCFYIIDNTIWTHKADVAIAAQDAGREVKVIPQLRAIGRAVPADEEWATDPLDDPSSN